MPTLDRVRVLAEHGKPGIGSGAVPEAIALGCRNRGSVPEARDGKAWDPRHEHEGQAPEDDDAKQDEADPATQAVAEESQVLEEQGDFDEGCGGVVRGIGEVKPVHGFRYDVETVDEMAAETISCAWGSISTQEQRTARRTGAGVPPRKATRDPRLNRHARTTNASSQPG